MKDTLGPAILSTIERSYSSRRSKNAFLLWEMIILGDYKLSFLERREAAVRFIKTKIIYFGQFSRLAIIDND